MNSKQFFSLENIVLNKITPEEACRRISFVGSRFVVAGVFAFIELVSWYIMSIIAAILYNRPGIVYAIGLILIVGSGLVVVSCIYKAKILTDVTNDDLFSRGAKFILIGFIIYMISCIVFVPMMYFFPITGYALFITGIVLGRIVLFEIGAIFMGIAFWRFGNLNDDDFLRIGAILLFICGVFIGLFLIGFALKSLGSKGMNFLYNKSILDKIKEKLKTELSGGVPIDVRQIAKYVDMPPFLLIYYLNNWIESGEIEGTIMGKHTFVKAKKQNP